MCSITLTIVRPSAARAASNSLISSYRRRQTLRRHQLPHPYGQHVLVVRPVEHADVAGRRQRRRDPPQEVRGPARPRSAAPNALICTPSGFSAPTTLRDRAVLAAAVHRLQHQQHPPPVRRPPGPRAYSRSWLRRRAASPRRGHLAPATTPCVGPPRPGSPGVARGIDGWTGSTTRPGRPAARRRTLRARTTVSVSRSCHRYGPDRATQVARSASGPEPARQSLRRPGRARAGTRRRTARVPSPSAVASHGWPRSPG